MLLFMRKLIIVLFISLPFSVFAKLNDDWKWLVIQDGFMFPEETFANTLVYDGGAWSLYYYLEQTTIVPPQQRRFLNGQQMVLFKMNFDSPGKLTYIEPVERYYWYSVDGLAKPFIEDVMKILANAPGWNTAFSGEVYLPLRFRISGGRMFVDYNSFVTMGVGKVKIGRR